MTTNQRAPNHALKPTLIPRAAQPRVSRLFARGGISCIYGLIAATIAGLIAATLPVFAADLIVVESQSTTAQDVPLTFEVEKTKRERADLHVWNSGDRI